ncbi:hypothetical protein KHC28_01420 [Ancylobacter sonchi]|uniref:hypothetical protein n=1 Tax=Ancylobacter sonchi TaxID=1937790 RepID=UPI001BD4BE58|nr:hypothetical protein [Ancylobacter sonchi]MBS7532312.1 hypothetical protein [Ancylobacter sonchi]
MALPAWIKLPSGWITGGGLRSFRWSGGTGADHTAALMALAAIAHRIDRETGVASATYDTLCMATSLSRAKLSDGLDILAEQQLIERTPNGRSTYRLTDYDPERGWTMLPAKSLCNKEGRILAFSDFHLRTIAELNALKLYFLFAAFRDREENLAKISYDKIVDYTAMERHRITTAVSLLAAHGLVYVDRVPSTAHENGYANAYRIKGLEAYNHAATRGRAREIPPALRSPGVPMDFDDLIG